LQGSPNAIPEAVINALYREASSPDASLQSHFLSHHNSIERQLAEVHSLMVRAADGELSLELPPAPATPWGFVKFCFLIKYSLLVIKNNWLLNLAYVILPLLVAMLLGAIYKSQNGQAGMQNRIGIVFFLISGTFLHNMLFVDQLRRQYSSYQRHRSQGYYGPLTYLCFVIFSSVFIRFLLCALFTAIVYGLANVDSVWDLTSLRDLVIIVALTSFSAHCMVWLVCCVVPTTKIAHFLLFLSYAFSTILAGMMLNVNTLPKPFQILSYSSLIRLGYESAIVTQFAGQTFGCTPDTPSPTSAPSPPNATGSPKVLHALDAVMEQFGQFAAGPTTVAAMTLSPTGAPPVDTPCYTGTQYMLFLGFSEERRWENLEVMCVMAAGMILMSWIVMAARRSPA
jgi:hypothetical protein